MAEDPFYWFSQKSIRFLLEQRTLSLIVVHLVRTWPTIKMLCQFDIKGNF